jgi:uncharacterized membrane protein
LLIVLLLFLVGPILGFALAYYIYTDAETRGADNGALWAVVAGLASVAASPLGGLIVLFVYVSSASSRAAARSRR